MDLKLSEQEAAFRDEVREFLRTRLPQGLADRVRLGRRLDRDDYLAWQAILDGKGWLAPNWPREHGGTGWSVVQRYIYQTEAALAHAPRTISFGLDLLAPVLVAFGSEEQKRHLLPRILNGDDWWCQGYSEPGAGSDLASLRTTAVRDGNYYLVNGQKTWTTYGHYANKMFALVRTSSETRKQDGISFLLIDMDLPGVDVRPIVTLEGAHEVNEVFLTDVRVSVANLVGEQGRGWTYAKYLLTHERTGQAGVGESTNALAAVRELASREVDGAEPLIRDPLFAARLARAAIDVENLRTTALRVVVAAAAGGAPGVESSMLKVKGSEVRQNLLALARRALGPSALAFDKPFLDGDEPTIPHLAEDEAAVASRYFNNRKLSIYGGSNEVQRNIVARSLLDI